MPKRVCPVDGTSLEAMDRRRQYCSDACRKQAKRKPETAGARPRSSDPVSTEIADRLHREFEELKVLDTYEAQTALGVALQLDNRIVHGAAYVSLSKELDRRVDALRLKAERPDDPVRLILDQVQEKQAHLRLA